MPRYQQKQYNIANILSLAALFYKTAGIFEAPPAMVARLTKATQEIYASSILYHIDNIINDSDYLDPALMRKLTNIKQEALQYYNKPRPPDNLKWKLQIDLTGWKYLRPKLAELYYDWIREELIDPYVQCYFVFGKHKEQGLFDPVGNYIIIRMNDKSVDNFRYTLQELEQTVRHELQHFGQALLTKLLRKDYYYNKENPRGDMAGLPSNKLRSKDYSVHGASLQNKDNKQEHSLRDVEFYTNLADNVDSFEYYATKIDKYPGTMRSYFNSWIGLPNTFVKDQWDKLKNTPNLDKDYVYEYLQFIIGINKQNNMFKIMLAQDPAKWKKAVNVFYTKVSYLLI